MVHTYIYKHKVQFTILDVMASTIIIIKVIYISNQWLLVVYFLLSGVMTLVNAKFYFFNGGL